MLVILHQGLFHLVSDGIDFSPCLTTQFDDENGCWVALDKEAVFLLLNVLFTELQNIAIHQLDSRGMEFQSDKIAQKTLLQRVAMSADHHLLFGWQRVKVDFNLGDEGQGAFAARQYLAQVDSTFLKRFVRMV